MKLRIRQNTIRFRLGQMEVARLARGETVEQVTELSAASKLVSAVRADKAANRVDVSFDGAKIEAIIPLGMARDWERSETIGIEADKPIEGDRSLKILIEKDFQCLHNEAEQIKDAYPNPGKKR